MNRRVITIAVVLLMIAGAAYADRGRTVRQPVAMEDAAIRQTPIADAVRRCLTVLELSESQRLQVRQLFAAAAPELMRLGQQLAASHEALLALAATPGADVCQVGTAYMQVDTDRKAIEAAGTALARQVAAVLTPEQRLKLEGCLAGVRNPRP